jgi:DNA polymerase-3 subunit beta
MKIRIDRELFLAKLQKAIKFVPSKAMLPAFLNFKLTVRDGVMEIIGSDQNNQVKVYCPVSSKDTGSVCLPAKLLLKTISLFRENEVQITQKNEKKVELKCGKSKYNIGIDCMPDDYPVMEVRNITSDINMNQFFLNSAVKIAEKFVDEDCKYANLIGIKIEEVGNRIIFTGAHQVGMSRVSIKPISNTRWGIIVLLAETANKVMTLLEDQGEITVAHNVEKIKFIAGSGSDMFEVSAVTSAVKFPNTETFFSSRPDKFVVINTEEFKTAVKRLMLYSSSEESTFFTMSSDGGTDLTLVSSDNNLDRDGEEIMTIVNNGGISFNKSFSSDTMLQILNNIDEQEFLFMIPEETNMPYPIVPKIDEGREEMLSFLITGHRS